MGSCVQKLTDLGVIRPDPFVAGGIQYETIMGSEAYGVSSGDSDRDIYGFCIPPKDVVFPHLRGEIDGFGRQKQRFGQWQQHHISHGDFEYDFVIYNIVKFFQLAMEATPNILDALYTAQRCVLHSTKIGNEVRDRRKVFLSKKIWHTYKGYSYSQMKKMKSTHKIGKRAEDIAKHGFDRKHAYHVVRLLDQADQLLSLGEMDLTRDRERMKAIRRGEWTLERVETFFEEREKALQSLYESSTLSHKPNEEAIKQLLLDCLEEYYGSLEGVIDRSDAVVTALRNIEAEVGRVRHLL